MAEQVKAEQNLSEMLTDLAINSPLNDESRLQVLIHLTAKLAAKVEEYEKA